MSEIPIPISELAYVCHNNARLDELVRVDGIDSMSEVNNLLDISPNKLAENVETGEYVGQGTVQMEGTIDVDKHTYRFEMEYWFDETGGGMTTFYPAN